jgi:hypothetical protein
MTARKTKSAATIALVFLTAVAFCRGQAQTSPGQTAPAKSAAQAAPAAPAGTHHEIDVPASRQWVDTNINLRGGARVRFTATGQITYAADQSYAGKLRTSGTFGPGGLPRNYADLVHQYAATDAGHGALIGRIGTADYAQAFLIGESKEYDVPVAGRLYLGLNESAADASKAQGRFHVVVDILREGTGSANAVRLADTPIPGITPDLLNKIPRRVSDPSGKPGDMVNVLILGTQDQVVKAFTSWIAR